MGKRGRGSLITLEWYGRSCRRERRNLWAKTREKRTERRKKRKRKRKSMEARRRMSGQGIKMRMALIHRGGRKIFTCI